MERISCWECLGVADERARGWRAYRDDVPGVDPEPILLFYCPACSVGRQDRLPWPLPELPERRPGSGR
jgi:hypothetical protein